MSESVCARVSERVMKVLLGSRPDATLDCFTGFTNFIFTQSDLSFTSSDRFSVFNSSARTAFQFKSNVFLRQNLATVFVSAPLVFFFFFFVQSTPGKKQKSVFSKVSYCFFMRQVKKWACVLCLSSSRYTTRRRADMRKTSRQL